MISLKKLAADGLIKLTDARRKYTIDGVQRLEAIYRIPLNFLHLLYKKEYPVFFGWDVPELSKANQYLVDRINEKLYPFFWRTNKGQLGVPPADPDDIIEAPASSGQLELALAIWTQEKSSLAKLIRLMQASTNPSLLKEKIDFRTLGLESNGEYSEEIDEKTFNRALMHEETAVTPILSNKCYEDFDLDNMKSPKFEEGLDNARILAHFRIPALT